MGGGGGGSVSVYCSSLEKFVRVVSVCARARVCVLVVVGFRCVCVSVRAAF